ncbi:uncharacterized protein LOC136078106 [Hydra vulgaris]|uniref:Uncharacterized protein LOC136078106 n=1 Tax=Hydra vulgaris TaxID=6087 RepID=A0ABM4BJ22_HYDVU
MQTPRKYGKWKVENLKKAVEAIKQGEISLNEAAYEFCIPKATLSRHINEKNKVAVANVKFHGRLTTLPNEIETELADHCLLLESMYFGLRIDDLRRLAFDIAEANNITHNFNKQTRMAGKKWYYAFMQRHPQLSLRGPESTSIARAQGFNKERVQSFFNLLSKLYMEEKLTPDRLYNMDETSLSTVQDGQIKIISARGKKRVGIMTSSERGNSVTAVVCVSAAGFYVPPMLIYKRKRMKPEITIGAPPGTVFSTQEKGWMSNEGFLDWLNHFIKVVKPLKQSKVLLILDGHVTHSKNLAAIYLARNAGVRMVSLPPHTTHRLQPLDVAFFGPLGTYYDEAMRKWMRSHISQPVTTWQVAELFGHAYSQAASLRIAMKGFQASGLWPLDINVFTDSDFTASSFTDVGPSNNLQSSESIDGMTKLSTDKSSEKKLKCHVSVSTLSLLPVVSLEVKNKKRRSRTIQAADLTSSPYRRALEITPRNQKHTLNQIASKQIKKSTKKKLTLNPIIAKLLQKPQESKVALDSITMDQMKLSTSNKITIATTAHHISPLPSQVQKLQEKKTYELRKKD